MAFLTRSLSRGAERLQKWQDALPSVSRKIRFFKAKKEGKANSKEGEFFLLLIRILVILLVK